MYDYIIGLIITTSKTSITLECNNLGYLIKTFNGDKFPINQEIKVYLYHYIKENINELYGFENIEQRNLFSKLLSVKGLGCKSAITILSNGSVDEIINAINNNDLNFFKKIPGIGTKSSEQIIFDLKNKFDTIPKRNNTNEYNELFNVLKSLGFSNKEITKALTNLNLKSFTNLNDVLKEVLKNIKKA